MEDLCGVKNMSCVCNVCAILFVCRPPNEGKLSSGFCIKNLHLVVTDLTIRLVLARLLPIELFEEEIKREHFSIGKLKQCSSSAVNVSKISSSVSSTNVP